MNEAIMPAFKRLFDAQSHWHNAHKSYFDPSSFRIAVNSCIQELRNVTFVLQNNKRDIDGVDVWYEPWQVKMRANKSLRWLIDARNHIVKQGDLDLNSMLRIEVIGSYLDDEVPIFEQSYEPRLSNKEIYESTINCGLPKEVLEKSYVKLERRWVDNNYPDYELLELLSICWLAVEELLNDAPTLEVDEAKKHLKSAKVPPCMHQGSEARSIWMKVHKNDLIPTIMHEQELDITDGNIDKIKKRYGDAPFFENVDRPKNFKETCEFFFKQAMYVLKKDRHHVHLAVIFVDSTPAIIKEIKNEDQADKYRTMRLLASEIEKIGANEFLMISEVWKAPFDPNHPHRHASESPERTELLSLVGISRDGEGYSFHAPFSRNKGAIELGELVCGGVDGMNIIQPIISIWEKAINKKS